MPSPRQIPFAEIAEAVADQAGVPVSELVGATWLRGRRHWPRQRLMFLARRLRPDLTFPWLAKHTARRDHTTARAAWLAGERRYTQSADEQAIVTEILGRLGVEALPDRGRPLAGLWRIERSIRACEGQLARLHQARAELEARL